MPRLALLAVMALALLLATPLAHAEEIPLSASVNTTELRAGVNYTAEVPMAIVFDKPVNITLYTESGTVTLANAMNVTLEPGVRLTVSANVTAGIHPVERETRLSAGYTPLASACIQASSPRDVASLSVEGPAKVAVRFDDQNDYLIRYYIVTVDDNPARWTPIWYRNAKRLSNPPTLRFGTIGGDRVVHVNVPAGSHTVYAAVSTFMSNGWTICIDVISGNNGGSTTTTVIQPPVQSTPPQQTYTPPQTHTVIATNTNTSSSDNTKLIAIAAGAGVFLLALLFLASRK